MTVFDIRTGRIKYAESFDYAGHVDQCGGKSPNVPKPPAAPKAAKDPAIVSQEAVDAQKKRQQKYMGLAGTIMTGGMGLADKAVVGQKTLLGR
jgi:hypothetical protein